jgi:hypothetical protein
MELSLLKIKRSRIMVAAIALAIGAGTLQAASAPAYKLSVPAAGDRAFTLTCSSAAGTTPKTVTVTPTTAITATSTTSYAVSVASGLPSWLIVTPPSNATLDKNNPASVAFTFTLAPGCAGVTAAGSPLTVTFKYGTTADITIAITIAAPDMSASALNASSITVTCDTNHINAPAQTVLVTSAAIGGSPFASVTSTGNSWLTVTQPAANSIATAAGTPFTVQANCTNQTQGTNVASGTITLVQTGVTPAANNRTVNVSLTVTAPSILKATPSNPTITYTKGSGLVGHQDVTISVASPATPATFFTVDQTSLPSWLTVDSTMGTTPKTLRFSSTSVADSLAPGNYSGTVIVNVVGVGGLPVTVTLQLNNPAPTLKITGGNTQTYSYVVGQTFPSGTITLTSSDTPISYSVTDSGGILNPINTQGLAYNFGTTIPLTFNQAAFGAAAPGMVLTGMVSIVWGNPSTTTVVTVNVNVISPTASVTGISPASLPAATTGSFTLTLTGSGFISNTNANQPGTVVEVMSGGVYKTDTNIQANYINSTTLGVLINVPTTNAELAIFPFNTTTTAQVTLGICNPPPNSLTCTPSGSQTFTISAKPIIQAITSASKFNEVSGKQTVAPYDIISIFGSNFCSSGGVVCTQLMYGATADNNKIYKTNVSPDNSGTLRLLSVQFYPTGGGASAPSTGSGLPVSAPILFATNNQINALVPGSALSANTDYDVQVNFGTGNVGTATMISSDRVTVHVASTNLGIFTLGSNGQGDGAILDSTYAALSSTNPGAMRKGTDSDTVTIYMTGLGAPSTGVDQNAASEASGATWANDCISTASYLSSLQGDTGIAPPGIDGAIIRQDLIKTNRFPPCVSPSDPNVPWVYIADLKITPTFAGWVGNSIAGLYQVQFKLPLSTTTFHDTTGAAIPVNVATQLPLKVETLSAGNAVVDQSQNNVTIWVAPRLQMTVSGSNTAGTVGTPWPNNNDVVVATDGTPPYQYLVTSGLLPSGLALTPIPGVNLGAQITGTPAANTAGSYKVTVTATDSANIGVTGTAVFNLTVGNGLALSYSGTTLSALVGASVGFNVTTVTATGGTGPYTYTIAADTVAGTATLPAWLNAIGSDGLGVDGVLNLTASPLVANAVAHVIVNAQDVNHAAGLIHLTVTINPTGLVVIVPGPLAVDAGAANANVGQLSVAGCAACQFTPTTGHNVPAGITIATNGVISVDTSLSAGTTPQIYVTATNPANGATGNAAPFTITVNQALSLTLSTAATPITVIAGTPGTVTQVIGSLGTLPYGNYTISAGNLPTGLSIAAGTGVISGTPSTTTYAAGSGPVVVNTTARLTDAAGGSTTIPVNITVYSQMTMSGQTLIGTVGTATANFATMVATGGNGSANYTYSAPALAALGLSIGATTGIISGTPTSATQSPITVTVSDTAGGSTTAQLTMAVYDPLVMTPQALSGSTSAPVSFTLAASGGRASSYVFGDDGVTLEGLGLTLNSATGAITGTPNGTSTGTVNITLTDGVRNTSALLTLNIPN